MDEIAESQKRFYQGKFQRYGDAPQSLSWNDKNSQYLRFQKIAELFRYDHSAQFSIHEIGCGLAHFHEFLKGYPASISYSGSDIVDEFIEADKVKFPECSFWIENISKDLKAINPSVKGYDYYCLNGTFHTKEQNPQGEWEKFVFHSTANMFAMAKKGICINFLTSYSDFYDPNLYYADPKEILEWCVTNCSRFISISHDIPLYEFFVYIYKEDFIKAAFPEFPKYFKE
jgi:hypothetical protein